ncbi:MAG: ATP-binding cassette domain-containing protein [Peptococcaceae bacterium]|nr:ATP-binding cassette domain-containing protein [Peptococcaceae bacterium]
MGEVILEADSIEYSYSDGTKALNGLSLAVEKGKKTAVLGSNGAGKSTLFLHFNGILRPERGRVRFAGRDISYRRSDLTELRKNVGIVFQDPDTQLFSSSVFQDISFGPLNLGLPREEVRERVMAAMAATKITHLKDKPTHFLSYGQKKLVAIAGILAMEPAVLIVDEPTAGLDPRHCTEVMELLGRIGREGRTVLMSTHDVDLAYSWADVIYILKAGRVAGKGAPWEVFRDEDLIGRAGLARPWVLDVYRGLLAKGFLPQSAPVPRNKEQLFRQIGAIAASK